MHPHKILIVFAHPKFENSIVQKSLITAAKELSFVHIHDLYEQYPQFDIDLHKEQKLLLEHQIIILQHPFYWYSCPPLLKQWIDIVLAYGWAYGKKGNKLEGKYMLNCISAGGGYDVYQPTGRNRFTINEFLIPFNQTAHLCKIHYLPPFVVHRANNNTPEICKSFAIEYSQILTRLSTIEPSAIPDLINKKYLNIHQYTHHG